MVIVASCLWESSIIFNLPNWLSDLNESVWVAAAGRRRGPGVRRAPEQCW
ncbi:hypothetical protein E2C01_072251 [Portunus trituberculatus]|uniref:Uncharacterized protein n=1 Tax=Portunus trituberculatus TaxID=210409 RepID=A0A5B7I786_PORTR|nr:hypothetical protein [Portunus trituberculatus]